MKKLLTFLSIILVLVGCSSSDDSNNSNNNSAFNPPTWIQGRWSFDQDIVNGFKFTETDYCVINLDQENCFPNIITENNDVEEIITDDDYTITVIQSVNGQVFQTNTYHFIKIDSETIYFDDPIMGNRTMYRIE